MGKKDKINPDIKDKLQQLKLSALNFQSGGVYKTKDAKVLFPTRTDIKDEDKPRLVVVMGTTDQLNDPLLPHVLAVPVTTAFQFESTQDFRVEAGTGNLHKESLIKAGMIQPILKTDFDVQIGKLGKDAYEELQASVSMNLGLLDDEEEDAGEKE